MSRLSPPFSADAAHDRMIAASIDEYLRAPMRHGSAPNFTVSNALDYALSLAHCWRAPVLAECLLYLALAWRRGGGAVESCAKALRHAVAELAIDLPLGELPGASEGEEGGPP